MQVTTDRSAASRFGGRTLIRRRVFLLLAAFACVTAGVLAALLLYLRADALAAGEKVLRAFAQVASEQTIRTLQSVDDGLEDVEELLHAATAAGTATQETIQVGLRKVLESRPFLSQITVIDEQGQTVYGSDGHGLGIDLSGREVFTYRRDNPDAAFWLGTPVVARTTRRWIIPATRPWRRPDGKFGGVIVASLDPQFFDRVWKVDEDVMGLAVVLWRDDGTLLMRTPFAANVMGVVFKEGPLLDRIHAGSDKGTVELLDGKRRTAIYRRLEAYPRFVLSLTQLTDRMLDAWWDTVWIVAIGWVIAMTALGALATWLAREWDAHRAAEDRYRALFKANPYPMVAVDRETGRFIAVSDAAVKQYGWSQDEWLGMNTDDLYPPEELAMIQAIPRDFDLDTLPLIQGFRHRKKDDSIFDVEMILRAIDFDGRPAFLATAQDVTGRLRAERAREDAESGRLEAEEQLRQSQKMEAVGQLTGGIAHDFNNILFVIQANSDALLEENLPTDVMDRLDQIDKAVQRAADLTRQLLAFSRKQPLRPQRTDLNDIVRGTANLLHRALGGQIEIESVLADDLCTVSVDRSQMEAALVNLCINARDAMAGGGRLLIETRNVTLDDEYDEAEGTYAMLAVTDTGTGIPAKDLRKVFEPFFTTKEVGKGTGLGLSMVYGFIRQSNGHARIYSEVGIGTTLKLYLPRTEGPAEVASARSSASAPTGVERILVVEDMAPVRANVVQQLKSLGYMVSEASDGAAGVAAFESVAQPYDLLLTDVVMPGSLNGKELASEVTRRWPKTKIVFMSGFTEISSVRHGQIEEGSTLLSKPFRKIDLAQIIRQKLDGVARG